MNRQIRILAVLALMLCVSPDPTIAKPPYNAALAAKVAAQKLQQRTVQLERKVNQLANTVKILQRRYASIKADNARLKGANRVLKVALDIVARQVKQLKNHTHRYQDNLMSWSSTKIDGKRCSFIHQSSMHRTNFNTSRPVYQ